MGLSLLMQAWDAAIRRVSTHQQGMVPANNLARRHPFVLNARIAPKEWSSKATRGSLPQYKWRALLADLKRDVDPAQWQTGPSAGSGQPEAAAPALVAAADWKF